MPWLLLLLTACAPMRRSWDFTAPGAVGEAPLRLTVVRARVSQEDLRLSLRLENVGGDTVQAELQGLSLNERPLHPALGEGLVDWLSESPRALYSGSLAPGGSVELNLSAHVPSQDLRRLEQLELQVQGLSQDGQPQTCPPIALKAPPGAAIGARK